MKEPTDGQINRKIAEFMGNDLIVLYLDNKGTPALTVDTINYAREYILHGGHPTMYTESLDVLIPVVEKLREDLNKYWEGFGVDSNGLYVMAIVNGIYIGDPDEIIARHKSPSQALARAIYEVIK